MAKRTTYFVPSKIDAEFPHQVALQDDLCVSENFTMIDAFCRERGLTFRIRKVTAIWPRGVKRDVFRLHCFADQADAAVFMAHFGGTAFDPKRDREGGRVGGDWRRTDVHVRLVESGPLRVPPILRN